MKSNEKTMKTVCIMCPVGCHLIITKSGKQVSVTGNNCPRGEQYGKDEVTNPKRVVTSVIKTKSGYASVKTKEPVKKHLIGKILDALKVVPLKDWVIGEEVLENFADDAIVIITGLFE